MEAYFSLGTYSINGQSITYNAPSVLAKEMMDKIIFEDDAHKTKGENQPEFAFNEGSKEMLYVYKP